MKDTFIIRTEWMDAILVLNDQDQAIIFRNLFYYHAEQENLINLDSIQVKLVWKLIQPNLQRNINEYDKRRETSALNGKKGGRPRNLNDNLSKPNKPNETLYVSDSVIDSASVSDSVIVPDNEIVRKKGGNKIAVVELELPFGSENFIRLWSALRSSPKWKKKTENALQMSLKKLSGYCEADAIRMMENCIAGEWQGLVDLKPHERTQATANKLFGNATIDQFQQQQEFFNKLDNAESGRTEIG